MTDTVTTPTEDQEWVFTFGSGQDHDGKYVVIAGTYNSARDEMLARFGNGWAFQYPNRTAAGVYEFGMELLPRAEWPPTDDEVAVEIDEAFAETAEPDYWLTLADDTRQAADQLATLAGTTPARQVTLEIDGAAPGNTDRTAGSLVDTVAAAFDLTANSHVFPGGDSVYKAERRHGSLRVNVAAYLPPEESELERLRAENAQLQAKLAEGGTR